MEIIGNVVNFYNVVKSLITTNIGDVLAVVGAFYTIALFIVKLTPTPKDNEILEKVHGFLIGILGKLAIKK